MQPDIDLRGVPGDVKFACPNGHWQATLTPDGAAQWTRNGAIVPTCQKCGEKLIRTVIADAGIYNVKHWEFDMLAHLQRQREFSERTFGPGARTQGVIAHIRKELLEIEADPTDISEWIDVAILALDGAWRAGYAPQQIIDALVAKQNKNEARHWPDWRTQPSDGPIEHVKQATLPADEFPAVLCAHANECPQTCPCPPNCYCRRVGSAPSCRR